MLMRRSGAGLLVSVVLLLALGSVFPTSPPSSIHAQQPATGFGANVASDSGTGAAAEMGSQWIRIYYPEQLAAAELHGLKVLLLLG